MVNNIQWSFKINTLFLGRKQNEKTNSLTSFDRYSVYQGRSLHICLGFVPMQFRMQQMANLDDFVCDIWIF